jgi:hypothetical protein
LIVNESIKEKVNNLLSGGTLPDLPGFSVNVVAPIEEEEQDDLREWGTADVLRHFKDKITKVRFTYPLILLK